MQDKRISPLDLQKTVGVGISLPLSGNSVFNSNYTSKDAIRSSLINYILTNRNERPLNPDFGANLREFLFEAIIDDKLNILKEQVQDGIQKNFNDIIVNKLEIRSEPNSNSVYFTLDYSIKNYDINDNFSIELATNG